LGRLIQSDRFKIPMNLRRFRISTADDRIFSTGRSPVETLERRSRMVIFLIELGICAYAIFAFYQSHGNGHSSRNLHLFIPIYILKRNLIIVMPFVAILSYRTESEEQIIRLETSEKSRV
jgi:hypothetical protein